MLSVRRQCPRCRHDVRWLGQHRILLDGVVRYKHVFACEPPNRRVKEHEQFVGDASRNFRAIAPGDGVFMQHQHAVGLLHRSGNQLPVVGIQRAQVQNLRFDSILFQLLGGLDGPNNQ